MFKVIELPGGGENAKAFRVNTESGNAAGYGMTYANKVTFTPCYIDGDYTVIAANDGDAKATLRRMAEFTMGPADVQNVDARVASDTLRAQALAADREAA